MNGLGDVVLAAGRQVRERRGFDSPFPAPWFHPTAAPEDLSAAEAVQMMFTIVADVAGFASTQLGLSGIEDATDVAALGRALGEIEQATAVLRRGLEQLQKEQATNE